MTPLSERVWEALQGHQGQENGITCAVLAAAVQASEREVRESITALREGGVAVGGWPRAGYFICRTATELDATCRFLRERSLHSLRLESLLRGLPLKQLMGQVQMELDQPPSTEAPCARRS